MIIDHLFLQSKREVFILRFWMDGADGGQLHGALQHVNSEKTFPLEHPDQLLGQISQQMAEPEAGKRESGIK